MRTRNLIGLLIITILVLVGCFFPGCHDTDSRFSSQPASSAGQPATTVSPAADTNSRRTALITALQNLRKVIASGDKRQIAGLFHFPIPDSVMPITVDDSAALVEIDKTHHLTEAQFDKFFENISANWELRNIDTLFLFLDLKKLEKKKKLEYNAIKKTEPLYNSYYIHWENDSLVHLGFGVHVNPKYVHKKGDPEDYDGYEFSSIWSFSFDGRRLQVVYHEQIED